MLPEINIGPLTLQTFGTMFALGFIAAAALVSVRLKELGKRPDYAYEMIFAALIGGFVGARVHFLIMNVGDVAADPIGTAFSGTGLIWFGGAVGGFLGVALWGWWRGMLNLKLFDMAAAPLAIGYAVGRVGCQLSGDGDYGIAWGGPWAMAYPDGTVPIDETVHPTPIYESLSMGLVAFVLWQWRDRFKPGILFAFYLVFAGTERFAIEFIRRNDEVLAGLTQAQLMSVAMMIGGLVWIWLKSRQGSIEREDYRAPVSGTAHPAT